MTKLLQKFNDFLISGDPKTLTGYLPDRLSKCRSTLRERHIPGVSVQEMSIKEFSQQGPRKIIEVLENARIVQ